MGEPVLESEGSISPVAVNTQRLALSRTILSSLDDVYINYRCRRLMSIIQKVPAVMPAIFQAPQLHATAHLEQPIQPLPDARCQTVPSGVQ